MARITRRKALGLLGAGAGAAAATVAVPAVADTADAELLALGMEFEAAWAREVALFASFGDDLTEAQGVALDRAYGAVGAVVDQIERMSARTLDGLKVKARAIQWCYHDDPVDLVVDRRTTDLVIANSIIRDLLAT